MTEPSATASAVAAAIQAESVARFEYGTLGPKLVTGDQITLARACEQAHEQLAANALSLIAESVRGAAPTMPGSYQQPNAPVDEASAQRLAVSLEQDCASAWRYALAQLSQLAEPRPDAVDAAWMVAVGALTDSAVRAVRWRKLINQPAPSVAFPGI